MKKVQKAKVGVAGSFFNQLMSNNCTIPEVGKGATQMHYTDRTCYEVVNVSEDGKGATLEVLDAVADTSKYCEIGHQNWILNPTGRFVEIRWRHGAWKVKTTLHDGSTSWDKIRIIFGCKDYYYDWSF